MASASVSPGGAAAEGPVAIVGSRRVKATPSDVFMQGGWGNITDAATYMGISVVTVHREIRRGTLTAYRIGGRKLIRILRADCDAYMQTVPAVEKYQPRIVRRSRTAVK